MTKARTWDLGRWQVTASPGMNIRISENVPNGGWFDFTDDTIGVFIRALEGREDSSYYAAPELEFRIVIENSSGEKKGCIAFPLWQVPDWIDVLRLAREYAAVPPTGEADQPDFTVEEAV